MAQDPEAAADTRVIELEADAALRFTHDGEQVFDIPVIPGETVVFRIDNTAGFEHSFHIGTGEELAEPYAATDVGIPAWSSGTRELVWTVPSDIAGARFGCTVPGHYPLMYGCFSEARVAPDGNVERIGEAAACPAPRSTATAALTPVPVRSGGRVEVPWAGVAVTFPDSWEIDVEPGPAAGAEPWVDVLLAYDPIGLGSTVCQGYLDEVDTYDWTTALGWSDAAPVIDGRRAARFDSVIALDGQTYYASLYVFDQPGSVFTLECGSSEPPPPDRWLSIAETFELLPEE